MKKQENKEETKKTKAVEEKESSFKKLPTIYYLLLFLTVLSSLFLVTAGVKSIELGDHYSDAMLEGTQDAYRRFYYFEYERDGIFYLGLAGFVLTIGLYVTTKGKEMKN